MSVEDCVSILQPLQVTMGNTIWTRDLTKQTGNLPASSPPWGLPWTGAKFAFVPGHYNFALPLELGVSYPLSSYPEENVIVCGGRDFDNRNWGYYVLDKIDAVRKIRTVINGKARGADHLASQWGWSRYREVKEYAADWDKFGGSAGPRRNQKMIVDNNPTLVIAFPGGRGTEDMVKRAKRCGIDVIQFV